MLLLEIYDLENNKRSVTVKKDGGYLKGKKMRGIILEQKEGSEERCYKG